MKLLRWAVLSCLGSLLFFLMHVPLAGSITTARCAEPACAAMGEATVVAHTPEAGSNLDQARFQQQSGPPDLRASAIAQSQPLHSSREAPYVWLQAIPVSVLGVLASLIAGLATGVGALPILFTAKISDRIQSSLLGFAAGVMLAATSFSLLIPSIEQVMATGGSQLSAAAVAVGGVVIGSSFIWLTDRHIPHEAFVHHSPGVDQAKLKGIWLFVLAIAIHNFPEGLAVGVGFGSGNISNGLTLAIGIGLQNLPEGLAVALALFSQHYSRWSAFAIALLTGLLEPLGGLAGVSILSMGETLLPWGLAFAAGAMLFVIGDEVIPEAQYLESGKLATAAIVGGFILMMFLDVALG